MPGEVVFVKDPDDDFLAHRIAPWLPGATYHIGSEVLGRGSLSRLMGSIRGH